MKEWLSGKTQYITHYIHGSQQIDSRGAPLVKAMLGGKPGRFLQNGKIDPGFWVTRVSPQKDASEE